MAQKRKSSTQQNDPLAAKDSQANSVRIIGGSFRGRKLLYTGDLRTRPMKDRVREAVFNLVGTDAGGRHAVDLFAGTGALGLEALSRGAVRATFIEQHFPTARIIRENAATLDATQRCTVESGNVFLWVRHSTLDTELPWLVFCSPPYSFYVERQAEVLGLLQTLIERAPEGSVFVVESDATFDNDLLPPLLKWDVRSYPPAVVAIGRQSD